EARYGEIARKMLETGNWVTPQHAYGVPFWAKPPLSTWLSALSMHFFGVNELAVRLPGLLLSLGILWLVWGLAKKHSGEVSAWVSTLVLAGTMYFFLDAGTVMTDPSLIFCTTLCMVAFWRGFVDGSTLWSYLFFVGLGLGMLAKGPICIVLVGLPIFFWILVRKDWVNLWKKLPWIKGSLIAGAICIPWYVLAEMRTPGFLNYFIIGEHFNRFLHPGWGGDKYGHAHNEPWGMIWVFAVIGFCPWSIPVVTWFVRYWKKIPSLFRDDDGWMCYLLFTLLAPLVFFTFASNIIYTYTFPCLAAFALLFTEAWRLTNKSLTELNWILPLSLLTGLCFLLVTIVFVCKPELVAKTQKPIVRAWLNQHPEPQSALIFWNDTVEYSGEFYSAGRAKPTKSLTVLCFLLSKSHDNYLVINSADMQDIPAPLLAQFKSIFTQKYKDQIRILLRSPGVSCE
ncbi:MAG: ArnT family glycosyltransferase, partial [Legionellales bacterium]